jgi:hypothetical protein
LTVDGYIAVFVFEKGEFVGWRELGDKVQDEGWGGLDGCSEGRNSVWEGMDGRTGFAGAQEAGYDCDWYHVGDSCEIVSKRADVNATLHKMILRMLSSQEKAACVPKPNR